MMNMVTIQNVEAIDMKAILGMASGLEGVECEEFEGNLLDNYILECASRMKINGNTAEYIIAKETYRNCWESGYTLMFTDDESKVDEYRKMFSH